MKDRQVMKKKKELILIILGIVLTIFYFTYAVTITFDSAHYMIYVEIIEKVLPFSEWDVVRGPVFPIIIHLSNIFFGKTVQGLLINSYIYYLAMLLFSYKILNEILPNNKRKSKIIIFTLLLIILNPIIYGYYHALLTEFIAITLAVISCYLAYKWLDCDFQNKKKFILYTILFAFLTIFSWFLKQPYVSVGFFPLLVAFIIKIFKKGTIRKKLISSITVFFCIITLVLSIGVWNKFLSYNGVESDTTRNPTTSLGNTLVLAVEHYKIEKYDENVNISSIKDDQFLSDNEKKQIIDLIEKKDDTFVIVNMYNNDKQLIEKTFIDTEDQNISTLDSMELILKNTILHPLLMVDSYVSNYLSIADIYATTNENGLNYKVIKKIDLGFVNELSAIGFKPYSYTSNVFSIPDEAYQRIINYEQFNQAPKLLNYAMLVLGKVAIIVFKMLFIVLPFLFVFSIVKRIRTKERKYDMIVILFGYGLLHMLLHTVTGAVIDRYAIPAYITTLLGVIILISLLVKKKEVKKNEKRKNTNCNSRI